METERIGFLGLGNMGFPMARNLLEAGYAVYGVDVNKNSEELFSQVGGKVGYTAETLPSKANIIFTSLPTPQIVENVYLGTDGLIENAVTPLTLIDLSTISPTLNQKIAKAAQERGIRYLGAPVSGSVSGAETATLTIIAGGEKEVYNFALPYFEVIGKSFFHVGEDHGSGSIVKLINNLMLGIHSQAVAEALSIADQAGLEHDIIYEVIDKCTGQSAAFTRNFKNFIAQDEYGEGAFTNALLLKDLKLAKEASDNLSVKLPVGNTLIKYLEENISNYTDKDISSLYLLLTNQETKISQ